MQHFVKLRLRAVLLFLQVQRGVPIPARIFITALVAGAGLLVTLPVFIPLLNAEGISLVWFGVLVVKLLEIGMITPPVGLNVFVIRNVASEYVTTVQIFKGVTPFFLSDLVVTAIMIVFPALVLALPQAF